MERFQYQFRWYSENVEKGEKLMFKKLIDFTVGVGAVCTTGFIVGVFVAAFLLPIFTTWKFVFSLL